MQLLFLCGNLRLRILGSSLCSSTLSVTPTLAPSAAPLPALVRYLVNHTFTGSTLPSVSDFSQAVAKGVNVSFSQIGVLSMASSSQTLLNSVKFGMTIIVIWEVTYLTGAIPSLGIVTQAVKAIDLASLSLKFPNSNVTLDQGPSVSIIRNSSSIRVNFDQYLPLQSSITAPFDVTAAWSLRSNTTGTILLAGILLTQSNVAVFNASEALQGVVFPLVVNFSSAIFYPNQTYTFRLEVSNTQDKSTILYDEVNTLLYVPPCCGSLLVYPRQAPPTAESPSSLSLSTATVYDISAPGWKDTLQGGALSYQFFFSVGPSSPLLILSNSSSNVPKLTTALPPGQNLTIVVVVQTLSGATSMASSYIITPALEATAALSLISSVPSISKGMGSLNIFLTALNSVSSSLLLLEGSTCSLSSDCLSGSCKDGICVATSSQKLCPSNSTASSCSGHGTCVYLNSVGNAVGSCAMTATNCVAFCNCDEGYGGQGCEKHVDTSILEDSLRGSACSALGSLLQSSATSNHDAVSTLKVLYQSRSFNSQASIDNCAGTFQAIIAGLTLGRGANDTLVAQDVVSIVSSIGESYFYAGVQSSRTKTTAAPNSTNALLNSFASNLLKSTVVGQRHSFSAENLQLLVSADYLTGLISSGVSPSNDSLSLISFDGNGLGDCYPQGGNAKLVLSEWTLNPYPNSASLRTNLLGMSAADSLLSLTSNTKSSSVFYMTLAFTSEQNLSIAVPTESAANQTVPQCITRVDNSYQPCNCNLSSYTDLSAVFVCGVRETLCPSVTASASKLSFQGLNPSSLNGNSLDLREYSALLGSASAEISSTLAYRGSLDTTVLAVVLSLLFLLIAGLVFFSRWDAVDRKILLYVPKVQRSSMHVADYKELESYRKGLDAAFLAGVVPPSALMDEVTYLAFLYSVSILTELLFTARY